MPWKIPWQQKTQSAADHPGNFYSLLRADIGEIRRQGDSPLRDGESFSRYICDLCHRAVPVSGLRQCVICGRWACSDCWKDEYYVCSSCNGIIRLQMIGIHQSPRPDSGSRKDEQVTPGKDKDPEP